MKNATAPNGFTQHLGFVAAGNDLKPAANVTVPQCEEACAKAAACKAVSYQQSTAEANITGSKVKCYWKTISGPAPLLAASSSSITDWAICL